MNPFIAEYIFILNERAKKHSDFYKFDVIEGRKYYKVVQKHQLHDGYYGGESVHAFVEKNTLDVYKPASWKAPAKHVRYNLTRDIDTLRQSADPFGSYLYL